MLFGSSALFAQDTPTLDPGLGITTIPLYSAATSGASQSDTGTAPTLTVFRPQRGNGSAVIIAPGGGYLGLASNLEGGQVAEWFTVRGFTAFVLKYRLGSHNLYPIPLLDAQRAIRLVRSLSKSYFLSEKRIGIVGFSAGGHLAAAAATLFDKASSPTSDPIDQLSARPDFVVLGYPWLNAMEPALKSEITYCSVLHVLTPAQCDALNQAYTPKLHVASSTPPTFIFATSDDAVVPVRASVEFYEAMIAAGASVEMHLFRHGAHGAGLGGGDAALDQWPNLLEAWLRDQGLFTVDAAVAAAAEYRTTRKPGEPLTLDSPVGDIKADDAAATAVASICGPSFMSSLPKEAMPASLRLLSGYFPEQLSKANLSKIQAAFQKLSSR